LPNDAIVPHSLLSGGHRACDLMRLGPVQLKIGPKRRAEEANPVNDDFIAIQQVNPASARGNAQLGEHFGEIASVVLVVARHIHNWGPRKLALRPIETIGADMNIAGEHHDVCRRRRWHPALELQMEIGKNSNPHMGNLSQSERLQLLPGKLPLAGRVDFSHSVQAQALIT